LKQVCIDNKYQRGGSEFRAVPAVGTVRRLRFAKISALEKGGDRAMKRLPSLGETFGEILCGADTSALKLAFK